MSYKLVINDHVVWITTVSYVSNVDMHWGACVVQSIDTESWSSPHIILWSYGHADCTKRWYHFKHPNHNVNTHLIKIVILQNVIKSKDFFFVNWDEGTSDKVVRGELRSVNKFAIKITTLVENRELTGYYCQVKRELDWEERYQFQYYHTCT